MHVRALPRLPEFPVLSCEFALPDGVSVASIEGRLFRWPSPIRRSWWSGETQGAAWRRVSFQPATTLLLGPSHFANYLALIFASYLARLTFLELDRASSRETVAG